MDNTYFISQSTSLSIVIVISLIFAVLGVYHSKKFQGINNYLTANRNVGLFSLTTSLVASALGAWVLFGPAAAATWGGIGAVIGYALGTAFPMIFLIYLGKKIRNEFSKGSSLIEFMRKKFGKSLFKLILLMTIFYMFVFLCAEVTAIAVLINYISGTELWITALIVLITTLSYTLYGGLRASIFTDNIQMIIIGILILISVSFIISFVGNEFSFTFITQKNPQLLSSSYIPSYTAGLTFFIAVAATNLFHQGNWQRVYAAKNYQTLNELKHLIVNCGKLHIKYIVLPLVDGGTIKNQNYERIFISQIKKLQKNLEKNKVKLIFESDFKPKKLLKFINKLPTKNFGINYDLGNSAGLDIKFEEEKIYFHRVYNIHLKDKNKKISL